MDSGAHLQSQSQSQSRTTALTTRIPTSAGANQPSRIKELQVRTILVISGIVPTPHFGRAAPRTKLARTWWLWGRGRIGEHDYIAVAHISTTLMVRTVADHNHVREWHERGDHVTSVTVTRRELRGIPITTRPG